MKLNYSQLTGHLERAGLSPVYLVSGDQDLLRELACAEIQKNALKGEGHAFNLDKMDGELTTVSDVLLACNTLSLLGGPRVVLVRRGLQLLEPTRGGQAGASKKSSPQLSMLDYFKNPSPSCVLIVELQKKPDARRKSWKVIEKCVTVVSCEPLKERETRQWLAGQADKRRLALDREAVRYLVSEFGSDLRRQLNELDKIALYAAGEKPTSEELAALLGRGKAQSIFRFTDAVTRKDAGPALKQLGRLLDGGEAPLRILALLDRTVGQLLVAREFRSKRRGGLASVLKIPPWAADNLMGASQKFGDGQLERALDLLQRTDRMLKGSAVPARLLLEGLVMAVCASQKVGRATSSARARV